ncbi:MAG: isopenicillin N synthase family oxygenase, partial [Cyanobacteria bacterium Co-bin8]|nr:isopenicillin N synthase family oxygenase [Cyanobacteria bacterium Co-bin8]
MTSSISQPLIPTLDLQTFLTGEPKEQTQFIDAVGLALERIGFFVLSNPGVDPASIATAYGTAERFFSLDTATKLQYEYPHLKGQAGFTRFGREQAKDAALPDLKEFWHVNRSSLEQPDAFWPQEVPEFRSAMIRLFAQLETCAGILLEACALYLDQPRTWLSEQVIEGNTVLRIAHYPPIPADAPADSLRAAAHEDINFITLLCEATAPGLEVLTHTGDWLPLQAEPGQIIVDTGDMLQNLTNGLFKSTTHRVVNPDNLQGGRLSLPFFVHPRSEVDLSPYPACVARTGGTAHYPNLTAGEYL